MKTKADWRRELRARVAAMPVEARQAESESLCRRLLADGGLREVRTMGVYLALPDEPDLARALLDFRNRGIRLALPVPESDHRWIFRGIEDLSLHTTGPWGLSLPEPGPEIEARDLDAVLVPGRGFTRDGQRNLRPPAERRRRPEDRTRIFLSAGRSPAARIPRYRAG